MLSRGLSEAARTLGRREEGGAVRTSLDQETELGEILKSWVGGFLLPSVLPSSGIELSSRHSLSSLRPNICLNSVTRAVIHVRPTRGYFPQMKTRRNVEI